MAADGHSIGLGQFHLQLRRSNMNIMINDMNTMVEGKRAAITLFRLDMAAPMNSGGKLTDVYSQAGSRSSEA